MNNIFKRVSAGFLALLVVFGSVPCVPSGIISGSVVRTLANNEGNLQNAPQTTRSAPKTLSGYITFKSDKLVYGGSDYGCTPGNETSPAYELMSSGTRIDSNAVMEVRTYDNAQVWLKLEEGGYTQPITLYSGDTYSGLDRTYEITKFSASVSQTVSGRTDYTIELSAVYASVTGVEPNYSAGQDRLIFADEEASLVTEGTVTDGEIRYAVTDTDTDTAPSENSGKWSSAVPTCSSVGEYRVWYYAKGADGCIDSEKEYVDVSVHYDKMQISFDDTVNSSHIISQSSDDDEVSDGFFLCGKQAEISSLEKLEFRGSDGRLINVTESYDNEEEQYLYTFTMPDDELTASHSHSLRVTPSKSKTSDTFTVSCTNEAGDGSVFTLYKLTAEDTVYTGESAEAELTAPDSESFENLEVINEPTVTYYDSEENELSEAPVNAGTYTAKATVEYSIDGKSSSRTLTKQFTIQPRDISDTEHFNFSVEVDPSEYTLGDPTYTPIVDYDGKELTEDTDFECDIPVDHNAGEHEATFTGIGNFTGTFKCRYTIGNNESWENNVSFTASPCEFTGSPYDLSNIILEGIPDGCSVSYAFAEFDGSGKEDELDYSSKAPVNAGEYWVRVTITAPNYNTVVRYVYFEISKAEVTLSTKDVTVPNGTVNTVGGETKDEALRKAAVSGIDWENSDLTGLSESEIAEIKARLTLHGTDDDSWSSSLGYLNSAYSRDDVADKTERYFLNAGAYNYSFTDGTSLLELENYSVNLDTENSQFSVERINLGDVSFYYYNDGTKYHDDLIDYFVFDGRKHNVTAVIKDDPVNIGTSGIVYPYFADELDISFTDNDELSFIDEGEYYITISAKDNSANVEGTKEYVFAVSPCNIEDAVNAAIKEGTIDWNLNYEYDGEDHQPEINNFFFNGYELWEGTDYYLDCNSMSDSGEYEFSLVGTGNFTGEYTAKWTVTSNNSGITGITVVAEDMEYSGEEYELDESAINSDGSYLAQGIVSDINEGKAACSFSFAVIPDNFEGDDYSGLAYSGTAPTEAGRYAARAYFTGENFEPFAVYDTFEITPLAFDTNGNKRLYEIKFDLTRDEQTYNGNSQTASFTLKYNNAVLEEGKDYILTCEEQTNAGNYTFTAEGIGNFSGSFECDWTIEKLDLGGTDENGNKNCYILSCQGNVYSPVRIEFFTSDGEPWSVSTDDKAYMNSVDFPFILSVDGSTDVPDTLDELRSYSFSLTAKDGTNYTGTMPSQSFATTKVTTYGMPAYVIGKEYDGRYLDFSNIKFYDTVYTEGTDFYKSFHNGNPLVVDCSPWIERKKTEDGQISYLSNDGKWHVNGDIKFWVINTVDPEYAEISASSYTPPDLPFDGKSAGIQMVVTTVDSTEFEHTNFTNYVEITKTKPEHIYGVKLTADDKVWDGLPYDVTSTALEIVSCDQFENPEENLVAQEVIANHKTVTYTYAEMPEDYTGSLDELTYSYNVPSNPGSYVIKATTCGDNFEEVSFYDTFSIAAIDLADIDEPDSGFELTLDDTYYEVSGIGTVDYQGQTMSNWLTLEYNGTKLVEGVDFEIECEPQTKVGTYEYTLNGLGHFTGSYTGEWEIKDPLITIEDAIASPYKPVIINVRIGFGVWIINTAVPDTYTGDQYPFIIRIGDDPDDPVPSVFDRPGKYNIYVQAKEEITGTDRCETLIQGLEILPISDYSLGYTFNGKEFDGNYLSHTDFTAPDGDSPLEELLRTGTYLDRSPWNELSGEEQCDIAYWVVDTGSENYPADDAFPHPDFDCDGRSAGTQLVVFSVEHENWKPTYFAFYAVINRAKAENIHGVKLTAEDKTYDGKPYDGTSTALSVVSCEQFDNTEENLVAQEVVENHKTVTYSYAEVPEGYSGDLDELTYSFNAPSKPGSYAVKATTYGDNFEEVSFYDTFSIAKSASSAAENAAVTITTVNGACYTVAGDDTIQFGSTMTVPAGTELTLSAVDTDKVLNWIQDGNVLSDQAEITVTVSGKTTLTLVYKQPHEQQVFVQYVSDYGQVMQYNQYSANSNIVLPAGPTKMGYDFKCWVFEDTGAEATPEAIKARAGEAVIIKPSYTSQNITYTVTVNYKDIERAPEDYPGRKKGKVFTAEAPEVEGYKFSHWEDASGQKLSYQSSFSVKIAYDISLTACYVPEDTALPAAEPILTIGTPYTVEDGAIHKVSCVATRSVPEGYTVTAAGMLYARNSQFAEDEFILSNADIRRYTPINTDPNGFVTMNVSVSDDNVAVTFRGYMIITNNETGESETIYSALVTASYSDISE